MVRSFTMSLCDARRPAMKFVAQRSGGRLPVAVTLYQAQNGFGEEIYSLSVVEPCRAILPKVTACAQAVWIEDRDAFAPGLDQTVRLELRKRR